MRIPAAGLQLDKTTCRLTSLFTALKSVESASSAFFQTCWLTIIPVKFHEWVKYLPLVPIPRDFANPASEQEDEPAITMLGHLDSVNYGTRDAASQFASFLHNAPALRPGGTDVRV
jgi:hypothetical protein